MLSIHKTIDGKMTRLEEFQPGSWVNLTRPSAEELELVSTRLGIQMDFLRAALDEEETSRVESEGGQTLLIVDYPDMEKEEMAVVYSTLPMGIVVTQDYLVTVTLKESGVIQDFADGFVRGVSTQKRTGFIFHILLRVAKRFLLYLRQIDKIYSHMERQLYRSQRNKELIQLLDLEKSLVYFSTSLKADEVTLNKLLRGKVLTLYEEDQDLLEDVLIEVHQAIEMANIYSSIISGMMDAFASVISNNLNVIMKFLAAITILIELPNIIFGFYGMNVIGLPMSQFWWFPLCLSAGLVVICALILKWKDLF